MKCVLPTRGLIFARTISGILDNIEVENLGIVSEEPMPDCFNHGVAWALENGAEYVWMVEEDNELPTGVLEAMVKLKKDIVTMDYPVAKGASHIKRDKDGTPLYCGVGCTLIHRRVFQAVGAPWFETHILYDQNGNEQLVPGERLPRSWGGHDVRFFKKAREKGFEITVLEGFKGEHYRALEIPKRELNHGFYTVQSL